MKYMYVGNAFFNIHIALVLLFLLMMCSVTASYAHESFEKDVIVTSAGDLEITFIGHGTLMFSTGGIVIHVDPWTKLADYTTLPDADLILITHEHYDHLDADAIKEIRTESTLIILTELCAKSVKDGIIMHNGDEENVMGMTIKAIPAYNIVHKRDNGLPFHPKGDGNGYIVTIADQRIYIAGDTENTPEMKALENIDIAFLPMNLPYTMTPEMVADAAKALKPAILYPYHYGDTDTSELLELLKSESEIEVRIREMQ